MLNSAEKIRRLKKACKRGRLDYDALIVQCRDGQAQFHDGDNACAITAITVSGVNRICYVIALGGTLAGWRALLPVIEAFARDSGCQVVQGTCRPGTVAPHSADGQGYRVIATVFEKVL